MNLKRENVLQLELTQARADLARVIGERDRARRLAASLEAELAEERGSE